MAISDKLDYLIETKSKFKDRLNSLGAEITASTTFRNYINWLDNFYIGSSNKIDLAENGIVGRTSQSGTPTPSSPQSINSLTGNVSYTVSGTNIETRTFTIPLGNIKLNGINDYKDKIYLSNNKFYIKREIGIRVLTGTNEGWLYNGSPTTPTLRTVVHTTSFSDFVGSQKFYSDRFVYNDTSTSNRLIVGNSSYPTRWYMSLDNTLTGISTSDTNSVKLEKMKTYMSNNNTEVYYALKTSTITEITSTGYPALYAALKEIQDYLTAYKVNKEFILEYSSPEIEY